jgi:putative ABC transport system permease protein
MKMLWQDFRFDVRMLRRSPGFTLTVVFTLGLGIGLNSAIFSVVSGVLLRDPPVKDPSRIVVVTLENAKQGSDRNPLSASEFSALREQGHFFKEIAAASYDDLVMTGRGEPERITVAQVTPNYFKLLGVPARLGRTFAPTDEFAKQKFEAVVSYEFWQERFGGDPGIVGKSINVAQQSYAVIGVMPAEFKYALMPCAVWIPESFVTESLRQDQQQVRNLNVLVRLTGGASIPEAQAQAATVLRHSERDSLANNGWAARLVTLKEMQVEPGVRTAVLFLMGVVAFVLLIACANVAGLLLARSAARQNEFAVRAALGAARWRLMRQLLGESLQLALLGGTLGILIAVTAVKFLRASLDFDPQTTWFVGEIEVNATVLLFTLAISCLTVLLFGLMPALQYSIPDLHTGLKEGARTASPSANRTRIRSAIVVAQVALATVLIISTGESVQLVIGEARARLGFDPRRVLTVRLSLSGPKYTDATKQADFFRNVVERIQGLPGVQYTGVTRELPESFPPRIAFEIAGRPVSRLEDRLHAASYVVSPNYFQVMRIPLFRGRQFLPSDNAGASNVVIVNETFVKRFLTKTEPIGTFVKTYLNPSGVPDAREIVGVVGDVLDRVGQSGDVAQMYIPFVQSPVAAMVVVIRGGDPATLAPALHESVWAVDKGQPIGDIKTMQQVLDGKGAGDRLLGGLLGGFTALALGLSAIGIYGVVSQMVTQRTHEIGLRMALGAEKGNVFRLVVGGGALLAGIGTALGFLLALPISRVFASAHSYSWLRGFAVLAIASLLVLATALLACYLPARRAMRVDPMVALRYE